MNNQKGIALILSLTVLTISLVMAAGLTGVIVNQGRDELRKAEGAELFAAAEAGIEEMEWRVTNGVSGWTSGLAEHSIGNCLVTVTVTGPAADNYYQITATGRFSGVNPLRRSVAIQAIPPGFLAMSQYMFFVNNAHLTIGTGAEVWGNIHSNRNIMIYGSGTIFHDDIEAVNRILYYNGATEGNTVYYADHTEGVDPVPMPAATELDALRPYAVTDGYYMDGNLTVEFLSDGTVTLNGGSALSLPPNGVIFAEGDVNISGTVKGQVTVVSASGMNVTDNLKYESLTASPPNILGLIAERDIYIPNSAPNDLEIDAAMLTRTGKAWASVSQAKGTLIIRGSVASDQPCSFANTNGKGYTTRRYYYDENLLTYVPPHYLPAGSGSAFKDWRDLGR
ncbi:MAG: hypothetical protein V2A65_00645 [Candidatus Omnitrophota bacterium]